MKSEDQERIQMIFNMNEAAKMVGVTPATIRNWEKEGLFKAGRSENNYRIFTVNDIEILKKIRYYALDMHMSILSIKKMIIDIIPSTSVGQASDMKDYEKTKRLLSEKWKACREKKQLTLDDVAKDIGISASYLSRIENGQANVSLEILNKLASYYDESLLSFFVQESTDNKVVRHLCGEVVDIGLPGVCTESLVDQKKHILFPMLFTVEPGCGSKDTHRHHGDEFIYVLKGKMHITLNDTEEYNLSAGDSFYFNSYAYHSWNNPGRTQLQLLWIHTPMESS